MGEKSVHVWTCRGLFKERGIQPLGTLGRGIRFTRTVIVCGDVSEVLFCSLLQSVSLMSAQTRKRKDSMDGVDKIFEWTMPVVHS